MTPSFLVKTATKLQPYTARLVVGAVASLGVGGVWVALAVAFPSAHTPLFFFAWPFFCALNLLFGLLVLIGIYTRTLPDPSLSFRARLEYHWNRVARVVAAPFMAAYFVGTILIFLGGLAIGMLHAAEWLGFRVAS